MLDLENVTGSELEPTPSSFATRVIIRPIRPGDAANLGAFYRALSPGSRHRRFLAVINELPLALLARFARPDGRNEAALIAITRNGRIEAVVGDARFVLGEGCAEFALAVSDHAQGRGLGERLLRGLIQRARENGIACVYGDVLPENAAMLGLARKFNFVERRSPSDPRLLRVHKLLNAWPG